jgi:hypothetical protein
MNESFRVMGIESCPDGHLCVLCGFLLLYERVERDVYGFGVEDVEITEVAEKAEITEVAEMAEMFRMIIQRTARHVLQPITEYVRGIRMTARHVIWPLAEKAEVSEMAEAFSKTTRHVL